jgi:hypothetical protein
MLLISRRAPVLARYSPLDGHIVAAHENRVGPQRRVWVEFSFFLEEFRSASNSLETAALFPVRCESSRSHLRSCRQFPTPWRLFLGCFCFGEIGTGIAPQVSS